MDLLNECEEKVAWPWQVYITLVCLLAKEVEGERPISLLTMLYSIWSRTRKHFAAEWCDAKAGFWDDAVRGSSPLEAALRRLVADELTQHTENQEACIVLFDVESFYDSISLSLVHTPVLLGLALLGFGSKPQDVVDSAKELSSAMVWQRDALKETTLRDWRSATSCRSRTSCTHPPRLRNWWMTWHSERSLRRVRWSTRRWRRLFSWCGTCKRTRTSWRLRQSQWSLQLHQALPSRLCQFLQDITYTSRKPRIWAWTCPV